MSNQSDFEEPKNQILDFKVEEEKKREVEGLNQLFRQVSLNIGLTDGLDISKNLDSPLYSGFNLDEILDEISAKDEQPSTPVQPALSEKETPPTVPKPPQMIEVVDDVPELEPKQLVFLTDEEEKVLQLEKKKEKANLPIVENYDEECEYNDCPLGIFLWEQEMKIYFRGGKVPTQLGLFPLAIISAQKNAESKRMRELAKTLSNYDGEDDEGFLVDVFIMVPKHLLKVYLASSYLQEYLSKVNIHLVGYTVKEPYLNQTSRFYRQMNVGDARNSTLALGCILKKNYLLVSDDDRCFIYYHFAKKGEQCKKGKRNEGKVVYRWIQRDYATKHEKMVEFKNHIDELLLATPNTALLGLLSLFYRSRHFHGKTDETRLQSMVLPESKSKCAQLVAINFSLLREDQITYPSTRMGEDNAFQYDLSKKYRCVASGHICHESKKSDDLESSCRTDHNAHKANYTEEDKQQWFRMTKTGVVQVQKNSVNIRWSTKGKTWDCPSFKDIQGQNKTDVNLGWKYMGNLFAEYRDNKEYRETPVDV